MNIRILDENERLDALNLARTIYLSKEDEDPTAFLTYLSEHTDHLVMLGAYDGDLTGMLGYDPETWNLAMLFIRQDVQGTGVAAELFARLKEEAHQVNASRLTAYIREEDLDLYSTAGFEVLEEKKQDGSDYLFLEYLLQKEDLGRKVKVIIDQPYGSFHPLLPDLMPMNCGYILSAGDGNLQNACVYGVREPMDEFEGIVIGVIYHRHDNETRWIVAENKEYDQQDVINTIGSIEQFDETRFLWAEKSCLFS